MIHKIVWNLLIWQSQEEIIPELIETGVVEGAIQRRQVEIFQEELKQMKSLGSQKKIGLKDYNPSIVGMIRLEGQVTMYQKVHFMGQISDEY